MSNIGNRPDFIIIDEAGEVTEGMYKTIKDSKPESELKPESVSVPETRQQRRARERREAKQKAKQLKKYRKGI